MGDRLTIADERYVWVARDKSSEWKAIHSFQLLGHLPFRPLIEMVCEPFLPNRLGNTSTPKQVIQRLAENLFGIVSSGPVWVDLGNLSALETFTAADVARMLGDLRTQAREWAHLIVPVVRTTSSPQFVDAAIRWASSTGSGLCIRVMGLNDVVAQSAFVDSTIRLSRLDHGDIDLIIDAQDLPSVMAQHQVAVHYPLCQSSRTWAIVSGTFPREITHLSPDSYVHLLPRTEWSAFMSDLSLPEGWRTPVYGDYATQGSIYAPSPGHSASPPRSATLRDKSMSCFAGGRERRLISLSTLATRGSCWRTRFFAT